MLGDESCPSPAHCESDEGAPIEHLTQRMRTFKLIGQRELQLGERTDHPEKVVQVVEAGIAFRVEGREVAEIAPREIPQGARGLLAAMFAASHAAMEAVHLVDLGKSDVGGQRPEPFLEHRQTGVDQRSRRRVRSTRVLHVEEVVKGAREVRKEPRLPLRARRDTAASQQARLEIEGADEPREVARAPVPIGIAHENERRVEPRAPVRFGPRPLAPVERFEKGLESARRQEWRELAKRMPRARIQKLERGDAVRASRSSSAAMQCAVV